MLEGLIIKAQGADNEAMLELINKFSPLLKKYARRLNYEDAQNDLILYFIQLIHGMNLEKMLCKENGSIINYISICIKNYHNKKIAEIVNLKKEIVHTSLSEEQLYYVDVKLSGVDETDFLYELGSHQLLNESEFQVIYLIYSRGYTVVEVAKIINKSRQAVNQMKIRALKKLRSKL